MIKKIGITGGIGSGKSTVSSIFEFLGIPVFYADDEAKKIMTQDKELITNIKNVFGEKAYNGDELNRSYLAGIVFKDQESLQKLNGIVHPALGRHFEKWHASQEGVPYTLKEAAILFEMGAAASMDKVITVFAPEALRIKRVMDRDGVSEASVRDRISKQMPDEEKVKKADYVIFNDGQQSLLHQVLKIHKDLVS